MGDFPTLKLYHKTDNSLNFGSLLRFGGYAIAVFLKNASTSPVSSVGRMWLTLEYVGGSESVFRCMADGSAE